jgi:hypothetical protein
VLLVIFGAGASFDSVPDRLPGQILPALRPALVADHPENDRPPLASQLFDNRPSFVRAMTRFPDCIPLMHPLRKPNIMVEQELARIQDQAEEYPPVHRELASIRYYLHFALSECQNNWERRHSGLTNYATFLREIERWRLEFKERVCLVTFNYDTMLDEELGRLLRIQIQDMSDYAQENYALIKPHGSINWGLEVNGAGPVNQYQRTQDIIEFVAAAPGMRVSDRYRVVKGFPMLKDGEQLLFPAISIPVVNKNEFTCPATHVQVLLGMLPRVNKILTIGWRATEEHFLALLQLKLVAGQQDLMVVSGDNRGAAETFENLTRSALTLTRPYQSIVSGFTGLINNLEVLEKFLRS